MRLLRLFVEILNWSYRCQSTSLNSRIKPLPEMASFLSLPREVRDMIYKECLVVGVEINPYPAFYESTTRSNAHDLSLALLSVNRLIGAEARIVLYEANRWRTNSVTSPNKEAIFQLYPELFRNITLCLSHRDVDDNTKARIYYETHSLPENHWWGEDNEEQKATHIHEKCLSEALNSWASSVLGIHMLPNLQFLKYDLEHLYCPSGCCRRKLFMPGSGLMFNLPGNLLSAMPPRPNPLPKYLVSGLLNDWERNIMRDEYGIRAVDAKTMA